MQRKHIALGKRVCELFGFWIGFLFQMQIVVMWYVHTGQSIFFFWVIKNEKKVWELKESV